LHIAVDSSSHRRERMAKVDLQKGLSLGCCFLGGGGGGWLGIMRIVEDAENPVRCGC